MCLADVSHDRWLSRLVEYLQKEQYRPTVVRRWAAVAGRFLAYLGKRGTRIEEATASDLAGYLQGERQRYHRRHHHRPASVTGWRNSHTGGLHMLLRVARGQWPPPLEPSTARDRFQATLTHEYATWMQDRRGLAVETRTDRCAEARRFLAWLGPRGTAEQLQQVGVLDLDAYVTGRASSLRRVSLKGLTSHCAVFCGICTRRAAHRAI